MQAFKMGLFLVVLLLSMTFAVVKVIGNLGRSKTNIGSIFEQRLETTQAAQMGFPVPGGKKSKSGTK